MSDIQDHNIGDTVEITLKKNKVAGKILTIINRSGESPPTDTIMRYGWYMGMPAIPTLSKEEIEVDIKGNGEYRVVISVESEDQKSGRPIGIVDYRGTKIAASMLTYITKVADKVKETPIEKVGKAIRRLDKESFLKLIEGESV